MTKYLIALLLIVGMVGCRDNKQDELFEDYYNKWVDARLHATYLLWSNQKPDSVMYYNGMADAYKEIFHGSIK